MLMISLSLGLLKHVNILENNSVFFVKAIMFVIDQLENL